MVQSYETLLRKYSVPNRYGVWTTYGAPGSWRSFLLQTPGTDPLEVLAQLKQVASVNADVTKDVLGGNFEPPDGSWALLIHSPHQPWASFAGNYYRVLDTLSENAPGRWLDTGYQKTSGAVFVNLHEDGVRNLQFSTDGAAWEEDTNCFEGFLEFNSDAYPATWPMEYETVQDVHQQLLIDLEAYIPAFYWEDGLHAGHSDAATAKHISRIDLIEFGSKSKRKSKSTVTENRAATEKLAQAIIDNDLPGVEQAVKAGADLYRLPETPYSALGLAIAFSNWSRKSDVAVVKRLLKAGSDPNVTDATGEQVPISQLIQAMSVFSSDVLSLLDTLKKAGADVDRVAKLQWGASRARLLELALTQERLLATLWLLNNGAKVSKPARVQSKLRRMAQKTLERIDQSENSEATPQLIKDLETMTKIGIGQIPSMRVAKRFGKFEDKPWKQQLQRLEGDKGHRGV